MKYVFLILSNGSVVHVCESEDLAISWVKCLKSKYPDFDYFVDKRFVWSNVNFKALDIQKS